MTRLPAFASSLKWRVGAAIVVTWLVPMVLALVAPAAPGELPFRFDLDAQARVLIALPLLIAIEPFTLQKLSGCVAAFLRRGIVRPAQRWRFLRIVASADRMRRHPLAAVPLLLIAIGLAVSRPINHRDSVWGLWYGWVSLSLFRFVLLRWYFWFLVWYLMLWRVARLDLRLNPLHSDGVGGLGFLGASLKGFNPVLLAQSIAVAGALAYRVQLGADPKTFAAEVAAVVFGLIATVMFPLAFFTPALARSRNRGQGEFGELSMEYVDAFRAKWIDGPPPADERLLGHPDLQSLADLHGAFDVTTSARLLPVKLKSVLPTAMLVLFPFIPLALSTVPIDELASKILRQLF